MMFTYKQMAWLVDNCSHFEPIGQLIKYLVTKSTFLIQFDIFVWEISSRVHSWGTLEVLFIIKSLVVIILIVSIWRQLLSQIQVLMCHHLWSMMLGRMGVSIQRWMTFTFLRFVLLVLGFYSIFTIVIILLWWLILLGFAAIVWSRPFH